MHDDVPRVINHPILEKIIDAVPEYSLMGDSALFSTEKFPWSAQHETNWQIIHTELDHLLGHIETLPNFQDIMPHQTKDY